MAAGPYASKAEKAEDDKGGIAGIQCRSAVAHEIEELLAGDAAVNGPTARLLAGAVQAVLERHRPFGIYDECDHTHTTDELDAGLCMEIEEIGLTCEQGLMYRTCAECCIDDPDFGQSEHCADGHHHYDGWLCATTETISQFLYGRIAS